MTKKTDFIASALSLLLVGCLSYHQGPMPGEPDGTYVGIRDTRVRYTDQGEGPVVLLVHGFASALDVWQPVIPALESDFRIVALDLKGFGWTDRPEGDYSPQEQAQIIFGLMDELGVQDVSVVAHSFGAAVALAMVLDEPSRVTRLVLYDAFVYQDQLPNFFHWAQVDGVGETLFALYYDQRPDERMTLAFYDPEWVTQAFVDDIEAALDRPGTHAAALATVRDMGLSEMETDLSSIDQPVLLLWGQDDIVTQIEYAERLQADLIHSDLRVFPRCGHFPMIEATDASNQALIEFLRGMEGIDE